MTLEIFNNTLTDNYLYGHTIYIDGYLYPKIKFNAFDNTLYRKYGRHFEIFLRTNLNLCRTNKKLHIVDASYNYFNSENPYDRVYDNHQNGFQFIVLQISPVFVDKRLLKTKNVSFPKTNFSRFQGRLDEDIELSGKVNVTGTILINGNVLIKDSNCQIFIEDRHDFVINGNLEIYGDEKKTKNSLPTIYGGGKMKILNGHVKLLNVKTEYILIAFYWNSKIEIDSFYCNHVHTCLFFYQINHNTIKINEAEFYFHTYHYSYHYLSYSGIYFYDSYNIRINNSIMKHGDSHIALRNSFYSYSDYASKLYPFHEQPVEVVHLKEDTSHRRIFFYHYLLPYRLQAPKDYMIVIHFRKNVIKNSIFDEEAKKFIYFEVL